MNELTSRAASRRDVVGAEVFANLFRAVVDEMAWIVLRSSHTTFVKETQDFGAALVTREGEMFAFPHSSATPAMGIAMHAATRAIAEWRPGDVLITNDPYSTGGMVTHLNDIYLFRPVFVDGKLLCFAWSFIHCTDVGGHAPGSIDMQNSELFQEGLRLRPVLLYRAGELNQELWHIFADNSRIPTLNWGDVMACVAALGKAEQRLVRLAERYDYAELERAIYATLDRAEQITRNVLRRIPAGEYRFVEYFEDDYISDIPIRLEVKLTSRGDGTVELDYTGCDPQVRAALNLPTGGAKHHPMLCIAICNYVQTHAEGLHYNAGVLRCIDLVLPEASVVNAQFPAACGMRYTTAMRLHDLVLGAMAQALPDGVPVAGSGTVVIVYVSTSELGASGRVVVANPVPGGAGAAPGADGVSGTDHYIGFLRNVPVEVVESEAPVLIRRFGLRPDSEGAGKFRGGFGLEYELEIRHPSAVVVMRGKDRHRFSTWGAKGGQPGALNGNISTRPGAASQDLGKVTVYRPQLGEVIRLVSGGGGGLGDPRERDPAAVAADVASGLLTEARARSVYGVALADGAVDDAATARQRAGMARPAGGFDFGTARTEWERQHGEAPARLAAWLPRLPIGVRRYAQAEVYRRLHATGPGPYGDAAIAEAMRQIEVALAPSMEGRS